MRHGLYDVLLELAVSHVFKHATVYFMHILRRFVLDVVVPELSNVLDL